MSAVLLVTMPWDILETPSIALGTIQRVLVDAGIAARTLSLKLAWMDYIVRRQRLRRSPIGIDDYQRNAAFGNGIGDWIFAAAPVSPPAGVAEYGRRLRASSDKDLVRKVTEMRRLAPGFLRECVERTLATGARVIGFTTTFSQNVPSLMLAYHLKRADPSLKIVFGGGNCDGPMGAALHRSFPWIDVVVRGECEAVVADVVRDLLSGGPIRPHPGLCFRERGEPIAIGQEGARPVAMDDVPTPDYHDYFEELREHGVGAAIRPKVFLSFETSRGCWWGEISHCTFCGLNGLTMAFRSKSPSRALDTIVTLARRHRVLDLHAVDNIIDLGYLEELLPALARSGMDLQIFYEVKSNLKKRHVRMLRDARVRGIQPGIESLSTPILRLMGKGVTAFQNLRLLKWCQQVGIRADWNLIYGFPGEPPGEYQAMERLFPALSHLPPPFTAELAVHRFSPYHRRPEEHGLEITGPSWYYRHLYDVDGAALADLAYEFSYRRLDGSIPADYVAGWLEAARRWRGAYARGSSLIYRRGPGFVRIEDRRRTRRFADFTLEGHEAAIFLASEDGAGVASIRARAQALLGGARLDEAAVRRCLEDLAAEQLVAREGDRYLGLALRVDPPEVEDARTIDDAAPAPGELVSIRRSRDAPAADAAPPGARQANAGP
jgi:ribosomal peptide maturation radical SAM protein 1